MKSAIKNREVVFADGTFSVWSVRCEHGAGGFEIARINWLAIEIASTELNAHCVTSFKRKPLTPIEHGVLLPHICFVVAYAAVDFDPGVCLEWHLLGPKDHLGGHSGAFQEARSSCGAL